MDMHMDDMQTHFLFTILNTFTTSLPYSDIMLNPL